MTRSILIALVSGLLAAVSDAKPLNIVMIIADDLGIMDTSPYNPETFYDTPHLQALAASATRFTNGYATFFAGKWHLDRSLPHHPRGRRPARPARPAPRRSILRCGPEEALREVVSAPAQGEAFSSQGARGFSPLGFAVVAPSAGALKHPLLASQGSARALANALGGGLDQKAD